MAHEFSGEIFYWRGPAPFFFITVPEAESRLLKEEAKLVTYGWGMVPVNARIGKTTFYTALIPKDGAYLVPIKVAVRRSEKLDEGDTAAVTLETRSLT